LPSAAEGFDEGDGSHELLTAQLSGGEFNVQRGALRCRHFELGDEAVSIFFVANR
jgi:hypothetical protein